MADEVLFEYLHMELVALIHRSAEKDEMVRDAFCLIKSEEIYCRLHKTMHTRSLDSVELL